MFIHRILVYRGDDLFGSGAIFGRHAVFKIAGNGLQPVFLTADNAQSSTPTIVVAAEAKAGVEVCQIVNHFIERIAFIFERGSHSHSVAFRKDTNPAATPSPHA